MKRPLEYVFYRIWLNRRNKSSAPNLADWSASIFMAFSLVILFEVVADWVSQLVGVQAPIEILPKWLYLTLIFCSSTFLLHYLFGRGDIPSKIGHQFENLTPLYQRAGWIILTLYFAIPILIYVFYFWVFSGVYY